MNKKIKISISFVKILYNIDIICTNLYKSSNCCVLNCFFAKIFLVLALKNKI